MRLADGQFWPVPIVLAVSKKFAGSLDLGETLALRDGEGVLLATLLVEEQWLPDKNQEARLVYESEDASHPGVDALLRSGDVYLSGRLQAVELPTHHDYRHYRQTPAQLRDHFNANGCSQVLALQPHHAIHKAQWEAACHYAKTHKAALLIQCHVGLGQPEDRSHFSRIRCHEYTLQQSPEQTPQLNLLNHASRSSETRELLLTALILRNCGCTHFMVSPEQGGILRDYEADLGICIITTPTIANHAPLLVLSDAELSHHLHAGLPVPDGFSFPEVLAEIQNAYPSRLHQGFAIFLTGLSGSGKSTIANALLVKLMEMGGRTITLLDGDVVRKHLSSELNFSKEHRDINIRRIGFVASEIVKNGGIAICAPIAPYTSVRREVRSMVSSKGGFIEVHVSTPLEECEKRDRKGLYAKARAGILKGFTGIDDPYEIPENPELRLDTSNQTPDQCIEQILLTLAELGYITH
ncbi:Sulfate adenylyltransferase adenylylsulfate kinase [Crenothrix polyspora]|uniref:Adenylyl-sulfate kinase n=2 Tax=Crenothrix polyspora TaxID=360316 RepID=A0A1R4HDQ8_9GAMM|nr:Sulfate adenylyltransferase adenylylsulfate kinase [Crenothrix polyspora]